MILFVDDEQRHTESYREQFEISGYEIEYKKYVDDALAFVKEKGPQIDLLILDVMMPPGAAFRDVNTMLGLRTGVEFFERVKQEAPALKVVALTNVTSPEVESFFTRSGCPYLLKKDYIPTDLVAKVREMLGTSSQRKGD